MKTHLLLLSNFFDLFGPEGAKIFSENETYPRALLHWTRAAAQGESSLLSTPRLFLQIYIHLQLLYTAKVHVSSKMD